MTDPNKPGPINPDVERITDPSTAIMSGDVTVHRTVELADVDPQDEVATDIARWDGDGVPIYNEVA